MRYFHVSIRRARLRQTRLAPRKGAIVVLTAMLMIALMSVFRNIADHRPLKLVR